jgi:3-isopropylmalate/(R)-2-methylmalate dehydratase large subunit
MDDRFAVCNMVVEGGAKNGLFSPDQVTENYLKERDGHSDDWENFSHEDFPYTQKLSVDLSSLKPKIALPHSPAHVVNIEEIKGEEVDQVFIGSCTGGRLRDLELTARILKKRKVASGIRLLITPASQKIYQEAMEKGYLQVILEAGGVVLNPSCGLCGGIDKGILAAEEKCVSTSNRNFQGRMGDPSSKIYLASPLTAAASALAGKIIDPREVM